MLKCCLRTQPATGFYRRASLTTSSKDVRARQAPQVTAQVATSFWTAYAHLARLVKPVTAASVRACQAASLMKEKFWAVVLVFIIITFSIFLL